jgi:hypothetical protein
MRRLRRIQYAMKEQEVMHCVMYTSRMHYNAGVEDLVKIDLSLA